MSAARLALGTVQIGLAYGVSHGGQVAADEAGRILALARSHGIDLIDTAAAYGDSEAVLGTLPDSQDFGVVTKTIPLRKPVLDAGDVARVADGLARSLARLRRDRVDVVLVHDAGDLLAQGGDRLWAALEAARDRGQVGRIGVSVYDGTEADAVRARFPVTVVQLPLSALDQRPATDGTLDRLAAAGIEVHVRSVFLQGLLLISETEVPDRLAAARPMLARWRAACEAAGASPVAAALAYPASLASVARIVVGVHSTAPLAEIVAGLEAAPTLDWGRLACHDPAVVDPRCWPAG
jgi:aryl-alcohol dehydrogenase-like predicted oxidoreductase